MMVLFLTIMCAAALFLAVPAEGCKVIKFDEASNPLCGQGQDIWPEAVKVPSQECCLHHNNIVSFFVTEIVGAPGFRKPADSEFVKSWAELCFGDETCRNSLAEAVEHKSSIPSKYGLSAQSKTLVSLGCKALLEKSTMQQGRPVNLEEAVDIFNEVFQRLQKTFKAGLVFPLLDIAASEEESTMCLLYSDDRAAPAVETLRDLRFNEDGKLESWCTFSVMVRKNPNWVKLKSMGSPNNPSIDDLHSKFRDAFSGSKSVDEDVNCPHIRQEIQVEAGVSYILRLELMFSQSDSAASVRILEGVWGESSDNLCFGCFEANPSAISIGKSFVFEDAFIPYSDIITVMIVAKGTIFVRSAEINRGTIEGSWGLERACPESDSSTKCNPSPKPPVVGTISNPKLNGPELPPSGWCSHSFAGSYKKKRGRSMVLEVVGDGLEGSDLYQSFKVEANVAYKIEADVFVDKLIKGSSGSPFDVNGGLTLYEGAVDTYPDRDLEKSLNCNYLINCVAQRTLQFEPKVAKIWETFQGVFVSESTIVTINFHSKGSHRAWIDQIKIVKAGGDKSDGRHDATKICVGPLPTANSYTASRSSTTSQPVTLNRTNNQSKSTENHSEEKEEENFTYFVWVGSVMAAILVLFFVCKKLDKQQQRREAGKPHLFSRGAAQVQHVALPIALFSLADLATDFHVALILMSQKSALLIPCLVFTALPFITNIVVVMRFIHKTAAVNKKFAIWLQDNSSTTSAIALVSLFNATSLSLISCRAFGARAFSAPLTLADQHALRSFGLINILLEDLPQLCVAALLLNEQHSLVAVVSIAFSATAAILGLLRRAISVSLHSAMSRSGFFQSQRDVAVAPVDES